jgi:hypothetical protein
MVVLAKESGQTMNELFRKIENEERAITFIERALELGPVKYRPSYRTKV